MADKLDEIYVEVKAKRDKLDKDFDKIEKDVKRSSKKMSTDFKKNAVLRFEDRLAKKKISELHQMKTRLEKSFKKKIELGVSDNSLKRTQYQLDAVNKKLNGTQKEAKKIPSAFQRIASKAKVIGGAIAGAFIIKKIFNVGKAAVKTAMEFEMLRSRLVALKGGQEAANKTFEIYKKLAATTPFDLKGLTEAGAAMEAFGIDSEKHLKTTADLAAYMGISAQEAASAWGRAWAGGAGAADIFRERGVLNLLKMKNGIEDLTKLTKEEFRDVMVKTFSDAGAGIAGATDILSKTATGGISNMKDAFDALSDAIFSGTMPVINKLARGVAGLVEKITPTESALEKVTKKSADQRIEFERLAAKYGILSKKQNKSKVEHDEYQKTIKTLNSKYGEYLGNINLEKDSYDKVKAAINGARDAIIEKTRVQAIEAEFADKQAEVVALQRQQIQAVDATAAAMAKLKLAGIDVKNITDEQLEAIVRQGTQTVGLNTIVSETAKAARSVIGNRSHELDLVGQITGKQNELLTFTERYDSELATAGESSAIVSTNTAIAASAASSMADSFVAMNGENQGAVEGSKKVAKAFMDAAEKQGLGVTPLKKSKELLDGIKETQIETIPVSDSLKKSTVDLGYEFERNSELLRQAGSQISNTIAGGLTDAIFAAESLSGALKNIGKQLAAMATNKILSFGIDMMLSGGSGGGLFGAIRRGLGFADGGEFTNINGRPMLAAANGLDMMVPPGFPNDSFPIAVQSGEHVKVTPAGETQGGGNTSISLNISALDPIGFERWAKTDGRRAINNLLSDINDRGRS